VIFCPASLRSDRLRRSGCFHAAESYARLREQWIETNLNIKGGEPVISGTRIGVRAVAQRIEHGDTIQTLTEDYPHIPAEAFQTVYTYAKAHPAAEDQHDPGGMVMKLWIDENLTPSLVDVAHRHGLDATCNRDRARGGGRMNSAPDVA
jgi:uncharacterized protein (DUF433 family)